jgi:hypothetical protein
MGKTLKKIKFIICVLVYPLRNLMEKIGLGYNLIAIINEYYRDDFNSVSRKDLAVMLPHCLVDDKCAAKFSKEEGILCTKCKRCKCGEIKVLCEEKGIQFYISPSSGFTKRLALRKGLKAAIGAACDFEIEKGLRTTRLTARGVNLKERRVIPQILLAAKYDCLKNDIDWEWLVSKINSCA